MNKLRLAILLLVLLVGLSLIRLGGLFPGASVEVLGSAMSATGAAVERLRINGWTRLSQKEFSDEQLLSIAEAAAKELDIKAGTYEVKRSSSERHRLVRAEIVADRLQAVVSTQVVLMPSGTEAYLVIDVEAGGQQITVSEWHKKVEGILAKAGSNPHITTCLVGWLDGKLEKDEWVKRLDDAGKVLDVVETETQVQPNFISVIGFSPVLPDLLKIADKRVNVNMAVRYSPYDNRTYVFIGSPVIAGEY